MLAQTLPEELLDLIFGCMHEDKVSLSHCSRVCRTWLFPSSRFLFRELDVHPQPELPDATTSDWYVYFLHGMRACKRVQAYVRHLTFSSKLPGQSNPACPASTLHETLLALPDLKSFSLAYLDFIDDTPASTSLSDRPRAKLSLDTINLRGVLSLSAYRGQAVRGDSSESTGLAEFLSLFEHIGALYIENSLKLLRLEYPGAWLVLQAVPVPLPRQALLRVEELHLVGSGDVKMLEALKDTIDPRYLRTLAVDLEVPSLIDEFLQRMTGLQSVCFVMKVSLPSREVITLPGLLACSTLQSIQIYVSPFRSSTKSAPLNRLVWSTAVDMLATAPPSVTHITLDLTMVRQSGPKLGEDVLRQLDWTAFDRALRRLPALEVTVLRAVTAVDIVLWTKEKKDVVRRCVTYGIQRLLEFM